MYYVRHTKLPVYFPLKQPGTETWLNSAAYGRPLNLSKYAANSTNTIANQEMAVLTQEVVVIVGVKTPDGKVEGCGEYGLLQDRGDKTKVQNNRSHVQTQEAAIQRTRQAEKGQE